MTEELKSAAAMLGRQGGLKGGVARAAKLSPERRKEIAKTAAYKRWGTKRPWCKNMPSRTGKYIQTWVDCWGERYSCEIILKDDFDLKALRNHLHRLRVNKAWKEVVFKKVIP